MAWKNALLVDNAGQHECEQVISGGSWSHIRRGRNLLGGEPSALRFEDP